MVTQFKISAKLTFIMGGLMAVVLMAMTFTVSIYVENSIKETYHDSCIATANNLSETIEAPLIINDLYAISKHFDDTVSQGLFHYIILLDHHGKVIMHSDLNEVGKTYDDIQTRRALQAQRIDFGRSFFRGDVLVDEVVGPVNISGTRLGTLRVGHSHEMVENIIFKARNRILLVGLVVAAVGLLITYLLASLFARPIRQLTHATMRVAGGDMSVPVAVENSDEIGQLADSFNRMIDELQRTTVTRDYLDNIFNSAGDAIRTINNEYHIVMNNRSMVDFLNFDPPGKRPWKCHELLRFDFCNTEECVLRKARETMKPVHIETHAELHDGRMQFVRLTATPLVERGRFVGVIESIQDITDQKVAEAESESLHKQLVHAQKMETVGRLAGGVAHDFNNLLSVITGYTELALLSVPKESSLADKLHQVEIASHKAETLVRQLLAFSRKQILDVRVIDINEVIESMVKMLKRIIGEDVKLELSLSSPVHHVLADQGQMEQVLLNLAVNARDAMPGGGRLIIETRNINLGDDYKAYHSYIEPGDYVMISVTDTGIGMSSEVMSKVFEPFFSTKGPEAGTGLGLATVYGTVKQHNGYVNVYSEPDKGTTFKIYLPATEKDKDEMVSHASWQEREGTETILVVEDEENILRLLADTLKPLGYHVLEAGNAQDAIELSQNHDGTIDVLLTDIIMPGMSGWELAEAVLQQRPGIKIIYMSGYAQKLVMEEEILSNERFYIQKPITPSLLINKLREVLDAEEETPNDNT